MRPAQMTRPVTRPVLAGSKVADGSGCAWSGESGAGSSDPHPAEASARSAAQIGRARYNTGRRVIMPRTTNGYLIRKLADAPSVPCPCGVSTRPLTAADGAPCSLHVTAIRDSARHYHRQTNEVYYIQDGSGKV